MNRYRNIKTGAIVDSPCILSGENWEKVEDKKEKDKKEIKEKKPTKE